MVMKDKLTKNYHKGSYYRTRRILFTSIALVTGVFSVSIPTYINSIARNTVKAEVVENMNVARNVNEEENDDVTYTLSLDKNEFIR